MVELLIPIISIGNSKGIRLPKRLLDKYKLHERVEIIEQKDSILIRPYRVPRMGWAEAFKRMRENGDDRVLIP